MDIEDFLASPKTMHDNLEYVKQSMCEYDKITAITTCLFPRPAAGLATTAYKMENSDVSTQTFALFLLSLRPRSLICPYQLPVCIMPPMPALLTLRPALLPPLIYASRQQSLLALKLWNILLRCFSALATWTNVANFGSATGTLPSAGNYHRFCNASPGAKARPLSPE